MTIVYGQIESLKRIKETLNQKGIRRFNSLNDINEFKKNYEYEEHCIYNEVELELNKEINDLKTKRIKLQKILDALKSEYIYNRNDRIKKLDINYEKIKSSNSKYWILKLWNMVLNSIKKYQKNYLEKKIDEYFQKKTHSTEIVINTITRSLNTFTINKEKIITERSLPKIRELTYIKNTVDDLGHLIAGAIGENLVVKELKKLSDKNKLLNDYSVEFNTPIYNRKENDRIYSIQIDHLLINNSGIFILETKNWSLNAIESLDLRSPIEQIMRTSYALFVILNGDSNHKGINIKQHHWGDKQIPIRNIIVMINQKPKEKFKYVQVKTLNELNGYINYFEPIFDDYEVNSITEHLKFKKK